MLYMKLTFRNARRSFIDYLLYIAAMTVLTAVTEVSVCIAVSGEEAGFQTISLPLLITVIQIVLVGYMDSFMLKQRAKEFAGYLLFGMDKERLSRLFLCEVLLIGFCCYAVGANLGFASYGLLRFSQSMQEMKPDIFLYAKSMLAAFGCFGLVEIICCLRLMKRLRKLQIIELVNERCRRQSAQNAGDYKRWGLCFLLCFACFMGLVCEIVFLPAGWTVCFVSVIAIPLLLSVLAFYQGAFGALYTLRKRKSVRLYPKDRLYIVANSTSNCKATAAVNAVFCICLLFSACSFITGRLLLHPAFPGFDGTTRQWMGTAQISICIVFLVIYFSILSLQQIIEIRQSAKNDQILRYLGRSERQSKGLVKRQIAMRLTSPMIMAVLIVLCCIPILNGKLNLLLPHSMRHILLKASAEFGACILLSYLCYFGIVSVMSKSKTTESSPSPKS